MAYTFVRWLRTGVAASLDGPPAAAPVSRPRLDVGVDLSGRIDSGTLPVQVAWTALDVLGPGDVTGIDRRQVVRTFPVDGALDAEPSYLAHVEFDRPDLPWMFTPHGPGTDGTLRPWMCLVVVAIGDHARLNPGLPLPRLTVSGSEVAQLPVPAETAAWAHVQAMGDTTGGVEELISGAPERILSRLVCPRQLIAGTAYLACVVPTFAAGALAGLGRDVRDGTPLDAWSATDPLVELPVYFHWEFTAGAAGDFRSLVTRLEARDQLPGIGTRDVDISAPGFTVPDRPGTVTMPLGGALRVTPAAEAPIDSTLAAQLRPVLSTDNVAPPVYGRWHAARRDVHLPSAGWQGWLDALNLDPRHRVAAGLGTLVVQQRQEDLMASIWNQLGEITAANQLLRQAQLAVAASERVVSRHLAPLDDLVLLSVAGPALARVAVTPGLTARGAVARSCLPTLAVCGGGGVRRVLRGRGPLERRFARGRTSFPDVLPPPTIDRRQVLSGLADGRLNPPPPELPDGAVGLPPAQLVAPEPLADVRADFRRLAERVPEPDCEPLATAEVADVVRLALTPSTAIGGRVRSRIGVPAGSVTPVGDRLDPILAAPVIDTPMLGPLLELGLDWLLPGLDGLPRDTIGLVDPEPAFIEAYLVGLNHEIGREMLWRGVPTDQRGTVFARFWDRRGSVPTPQAPVPAADIAAIHTWAAGSDLGDHLGAGAPEMLVLLVRGDLLQRYPRATIYLQEGRWRRDGAGAIVVTGGLAEREPVPLPDAAAWDAHTRFPAFSRRVGADLSLLGYPLARTAVHGLDRSGVPPAAKDSEAGWYAVFQEQPTEPRFGLGPLLPPPADRRSDRLAATLLRPAFRLFVHASDLVPG